MEMASDAATDGLALSDEHQDAMDSWISSLKRTLRQKAKSYM